MPDSVRPHGRQPTRLPVPGILQARTLEWVAISSSNACKWKVKVTSLSRVRLLGTPWTIAYQAPLSNGIFQARVLEWGAIAFFELFFHKSPQLPLGKPRSLLQHLMRCSTAYSYPKPQSSTGVSAFQDWLLRLALQLALQSHEPTHILPISSFRFKLESASLIGIKRV